MANRTESSKKLSWRERNIQYVSSHKRLVASVVGIVIVLAGVAAYTSYSVTQWRAFDERIEAQTAAVKTEVNQQIAKSATADSVKSLATDTKQIAEQLCDVSEIIEWQRQVVDAVDDALNECEKSAKPRLNAVAGSLEKLSGRIERENAISEVIARHSQAVKKLKPNDYAAHRTAWRDASREVQEVSVDETLRGAKKAMAATASEITSAYDKLIAANKAEDRATFDKAVAAIEKGYSKLKEAQNRSTESYTKLVDDVQKAVKQL